MRSNDHRKETTNHNDNYQFKTENAGYITILNYCGIRRKQTPDIEFFSWMAKSVKRNVHVTFS